MDPQTQPEQVPVQQTQPYTPVRISKKPFYFFFGALLAVAVLGFVAFYFMNQVSVTPINGVINYSALKPDPDDKGQVRIKYKKYGSTEDYQTVFTSALANKSPWTFQKAESGQPYELIAELIVDDAIVTTSEPKVVTAPATDQELDLRVTWRNLPPSVVSQQQASIKGTVAINGYIPPNSTIQILAKPIDSGQTILATTIQSASNENAWEWKGVKPLKDHILHAVLLANGLQVGTSEVINAAGGDSQIELSINSTATIQMN